MKKVILGLFVLGTMFSINNLNANKVESFMDVNACTVSGEGYIATAESCVRAREIWVKLISAGQ